jgi:F-type H+-transporting ATPase subunit b
LVRGSPHFKKEIQSINMFFLADFSVIRPEPGLLIWSTIFFLLFWFIVARFAFKPIAKALKNREDKIQDALDEAKRAREEMQNLNEENEKLLAQARDERLKILNEAKSLSDKLISEAKDRAKSEANKIVEKARADIESQKAEAMNEVKNKVGEIAIEIAEKVIQKELKKDKGHSDYVNSMIDDLNLN